MTCRQGATCNAVTRCGLSWLMLLPSPSCPLPLYPQPYTSPFSSTAIELVWPQVTPTTLRPPKDADTLRGVDWLVVVPEPIWPQLFWPQEKMSPSAVRQREWWLPHATCTTFLPRRLFWMRAGVRPWLVLPFPSWQ